LSGTSRCAEVAQNLNSDFEIIINVQGDEPFIAPEQIDLLVKCFTDPTVNIATLIKQITTHEELTNPNIVKAVIGEQYQALYFSRSALPYYRGVEEYKWIASTKYYKHIGIYGYRTNVLQQLIQLPVNNLEQAESLEQLRWMANGYRIQTAVTALETISIDTPEDLQIANTFLKEHSEYQCPLIFLIHIHLGHINFYHAEGLII
ncbi:MAG: 3-deoxy-manno-octulosonate cytidylyltransferase, partial [Chitinophagales bacterium]